SLFCSAPDPNSVSFRGGAARFPCLHAPNRAEIGRFGDDRNLGAGRASPQYGFWAFHWYLSASTGSSFAARAAGYIPAARLTTSENATAPSPSHHATSQIFSAEIPCRRRSSAVTN